MASSDVSTGPPTSIDDRLPNNQGLCSAPLIPALPPLIRIDSIRDRNSPPVQCPLVPVPTAQPTFNISHNPGAGGSSDGCCSVNGFEIMKFGEDGNGHGMATSNPMWYGGMGEEYGNGGEMLLPCSKDTEFGNFSKATDREVENAVLQVVQVFSKPEPDRQRLFRAVLSAVKGQKTIKEAATQYMFATSTMHPYVHRARAILGSRAPAMKSTRTGMWSLSGANGKPRPKEGPKIPAHLQKLKPLAMNVSEFLNKSWKESGFSMTSLKQDSFTNAHLMEENAPEFDELDFGNCMALPVESSFDSEEGFDESMNNSFLQNEERVEIEENSSLTNFDGGNMEELMLREDSSSAFNGSDFLDSDHNSDSENSGIPKFDESFAQVDSPEDAAREVIQNSELPETSSMGLFLVLVKCLNQELTVREAAQTLGLPWETVSTMVERARALLPSGNATVNGNCSREYLLEDIVDRAIRGSHYYGQSKERLHQAVLQTVRGDLPLTQAAATHCVPFSTLHPYVKRARLLMGGHQGTVSTVNPMLQDHVQTYTSEMKKSSIPGIVASGIFPSGTNKVTSIALGQVANKVASSGHKLKVSPSNKSSLGSGRGKFQDGMPELSKLPPHVVKMAVDKAVQSCQYDNPMKKQRLSSAVLEALSGRKTMKAAAAMHEVPFTTLQTYFHRSKAQIQREAANLKLNCGDICSSSQGVMSAEVHSPETTVWPTEKKKRVEDVSSLILTQLKNEDGEQNVAERELADASNVPDCDLGQSDGQTTKFKKKRSSKGESLWSKLKQRQDMIAQKEMDLKKEEAPLSPNSSVENQLNEVKAEQVEGVEGSATTEEQKNSTPIAGEVKVNPDMPVLEQAVPIRSECGGGSNRRKPKKVIHHALSAVQQCSPVSPVNLVETTPLAVSDVNSSWLKGDDDTFFGSNPEMDLSDIVNQFWNTMGEGFDIVHPRAPEDFSTNMEIKEHKDTSRSHRNLAEIRRQDEEKLKELLKSASGKEYPLEVEDAVERAIRNSQYDGDQRERLRLAALVSVRGDCSMKEAARYYDIPLGTLHTYFHRARNLVHAAKNGLDPNSPDVVSLVNSLGAAGVMGSGKKSKKKDKSQSMSKWELVAMDELEDLDNDDVEMTTEKLERVVERVTKNSLYPPEQKQRLLKAVVRVISGELTINAAANIYHLPSSTVHPYVHRARAALGRFCPPQAKLTPFSKLKSPKLQATLAKLQKHFQSTSAAQNAANKARQQAVAMMRSSSSNANASLQKSPVKEEENEAKSVSEVVTETTGGNTEEFSNGVSFEEADRVVTDLVKSSLYGEDGRQRLYEAILMVITDSANVSEAARTYQIPPSTIQPYVQRAKSALNLPGGNQTPESTSGTNSPAPTTAASFKSRTTVPAPKIYAAPGRAASDEEVSEVVEKVVKNSVNADDRRERLYKAVFAAVSGKLTIKDACTEQNLPASTVHPYVSRARHMLSDRCPPPKIVTISSSPAASKPLQAKSAANTLTTEETNDDDSSDGKAVKSPTLIVLSGSNEKENAGRKMLELQLKQILGRYNYRGDRDRLVRAISTVIGEKKTLAEVSLLTGIAQTTLSTYVRIARMFIKEASFSTETTDAQEVKEKSTEETTSSTVVEEDLVKPEKDNEIQVTAEQKEPVLAPTATGVAAPSLPKRKSLPNVVTELLKVNTCGDDEAKQKKIRAAIQHVVSIQYKQNQQAKRQLIEAIEDIMLRGMETKEAIGENQAVITEFVIEKFIDKVEKGMTILEKPLEDLYKGASATSSGCSPKEMESPPAKAPRKSVGWETVEEALPVSPTRSSRRLQEKLKAEEEADVKFPAEMERNLVEFLKKLENIHFPVTSEFVLTVGNQMLKQNKSTDEKLSQGWLERLKLKHGNLNICR